MGDIQIDVPVISKDTSIESASNIITESGHTHLPVSTEEGKLAGIITAWDIAKAVAEGLESLEEVMTKEVVTVSPDDSISSVTRKMKEHNISALPVTDQE